MFFHVDWEPLVCAGQQGTSICRHHCMMHLSIAWVYFTIIQSCNIFLYILSQILRHSQFFAFNQNWETKNSFDTDTFDWIGGERAKKGRRRMFPLFYWWIIRGSFVPLACCLIFRAITNLAELAGWSQGSPVVCSPTLIQRSKQSLPWPSSTPPPPSSPPPPTPVSALSLILGQSPPILTLHLHITPLVVLTSEGKIRMYAKNKDDI